MPRTAGNQGRVFHTEVKYDMERTGSPLFRTCLVAFVRVDGAECRPGRREHFSYLGRS